MTTSGAISGRLRIMRWQEWTDPIDAVSREVLTSQPMPDPTGRPEAARPPLLFVHGYGHGAWAFAEHWLEHAAERGYAAYAMSLRGHGESGAGTATTVRAYAHDVVQVAARLPRQCVLIGHGLGALAVARALSRYPAKAGVLVSPVFGGLGTALSAFVRNPAGALSASLRGRARLRRGHLFAAALAATSARSYAARVTAPAVPRVMWGLLRAPAIEPAVGGAPVLVVGSPQDRLVSRRSLDRVARAYGGAPLLFPGMGHDLMLDERWREPIDAIVDWLDKTKP